MKIKIKLGKTKIEKIRVEIYGEDGKLHNVSTSSLDELFSTGKEIDMNLLFYSTTVKEAEDFVDHCIEKQLNEL